jgi:hypothetical protein
MSTDATPQERRYQAGFSDPATLPEFQVIAAAMRRGTKRSTLRMLDIICSNNHRLAEVFGAGNRAVLLVGEREAALLQELPERSSEPFFPGGLPDEADLTVLASCRCRRAAMPVRWIKEQLAQGKKRVCVGPRTLKGLWS